jgi:hypothetical protein
VGTFGSQVKWETEGRDPMEDLRRKGGEVGYREAPIPKDFKGANVNFMLKNITHFFCCNFTA